MDYASAEGFRAQAAAMMDNCAALGLNTVLVQVRPFGDALYPSALYPWSHICTGTQGVGPGFDPLDILVTSAHRRGLGLEAWVNPYRLRASASLPGTLAGFQLVLHDGKTFAVNQRLVPFLHHDPVLRLLLPDSAQLEAVVLLLGRDGPGIDGIHQQVFDHREVPDKLPVLRVFLLPFGADIAQAPFPVPPCRARHLLFLQPAPDEVGAVSLQRPKEDLPDNGGGFLVHQQVVSVLRVFPIPKGSHAAGKLALLGFQQIRGMYLLGNILAIHLV